MTTADDRLVIGAPDPVPGDGRIILPPGVGDPRVEAPRTLRLRPVTRAAEIPLAVVHRACLRCCSVPIPGMPLILVRPPHHHVHLTVCAGCFLPNQLDQVGLVMPASLELKPGTDLGWPRVVSGGPTQRGLVLAVRFESGAYMVVLGDGHVIWDRRHRVAALERAMRLRPGPNRCVDTRILSLKKPRPIDPSLFVRPEEVWSADAR